MTQFFLIHQLLLGFHLLRQQEELTASKNEIQVHQLARILCFILMSYYVQLCTYSESDSGIHFVVFFRSLLLWLHLEIQYHLAVTTGKLEFPLQRTAWWQILCFVSFLYF